MATATPPKKPAIFNLPNQLTAARFVLGLVLFALIHLENQWIACLAVFALAAVTDWLDGYVARKQNLVSTLGRNLDPLVDKLVICGAYTFLLTVGPPAGSTLAPAWRATGLVPWMVTLVVGRELVITGLRSFLENRNASFGADWLGKIKMVLQCAALFAIFLVLELLQVWDTVPSAWFWTRDAIIYAMLAATLFSGLQYLWKAASLLKTEADQ